MGVSASHLDWTMVPYVRKSFAKHFIDGIKYISNNSLEYDKEELYNTSIESSLYKEQPNAYQYAMDMTLKEIEQAAEGLFHNLNTLQSRSGCQLPFTSINYGTCTLPEGRMVSKALLEGAIKGVGKFHKTPIFPCVIFQYSKEINGKPGTPNYDLYQLALKCTAKRLYPNYVNCEWSNNKNFNPNDPRTYASTMGCRTWNGEDINGLGQLKDGRGNICPVTIVMPTLAMEAKETYEELLDNADNQKIPELIDIFFAILDQKIHEAKDMLIERFEYICSQSPDSAKFMYENNIMAGYIPEEGIRSALSHGTLVVGQIGLAETLQILIGKDHTTPEGMELAKHIEQLFKNRCAEFKQEYKLNFGVYFTPAEGLSYTALKNFRKKYGVIPNVSDKDYFSNSIHVPVKTKISPFDKIDIESQLTGYSNAGCITYVELDGGMENNLSALEELVNYAMDKDIPYFALNIPVDNCNSCGYSGEFNDTCPECGSQDISHLRRVTGYLTGDYKQAFNPGKQKETEDRFRHSQLRRF